jgi:hypothetical protein
MENLKEYKSKNISGDMTALHNEALKSLCALQYYMTTLNNQPSKKKQENYLLSFTMMINIIEILVKTMPIKKEEVSEYPLDLMMIHKNIDNINSKFNFVIKSSTV